MQDYLPLPNNPRFKDLTGRRFTRLTVVSYAGQNRRGSTWNCLCDCGARRVVMAQSLNSGATLSCGCYMRDSIARRATTHGMCRKAEYMVWDAMKSRCNNPSNTHFNRYGGRGIRVCERWLKFENFFADMGHRTSPLHSLDRIDNNGNYEPGNCRWATRKEQSRNRNCLKRFTYAGKSLTVTEWSELTGIHAGTITSRIYNRKWSIERALTAPLKNCANKRKRKNVEHE